MSQQYPEIEESIESAEGTASHEIGAALITAATVAGVGAPIREKIIGQQASNGVVFNNDMFDAAEEYANDVIDVMRKHAIFGGSNLGIEKRIEAKQIHDLSFGTTDCFIYSDSTGELFIWDYKYGYEIVEAFENWQSINYAAGIIDMLKINGYETQYLTVRIRIVQPRAFHRNGTIREWGINAAELRGYINTLHNNAHKALSNESTIQTGKHCKYCSARHACPAALQAGVSLYEVTAKPISAELSPEALGVQLLIIKRALQQLKLLDAGFEEQVKSLIRSGVNIPGWIVEQGIGRERWKKSTTEVIAMGDMLGQNLRKEIEAITPTQARKLGIDSTIISTYSEKPHTGLKIVPDDLNKAKQVFKK